jgi:hypothetical protein
VRSTDSVGCILKAPLNQPFCAALFPNDFNLGAWIAGDELQRQAQQFARDRFS